MTVAIDPLLLLVLLAGACAYFGRDLVPHLLARAAAPLVRWWIERVHLPPGARIVPLVGPIHTPKIADALASIRKAGGGPIYLLIHTYGGSLVPASTAARALARYEGQVLAVVPAYAWSCGTQIACAADQILLGPDATLGPCDPYTEQDGSKLMSGPVLEAARQGIAIDLLRARHVHDEVRVSIERARRGRGVDPDLAARTAKVLTSGEYGDHYRPIYQEDAIELGLPAYPLRNPRIWDILARLCERALPADERS